MEFTTLVFGTLFVLNVIAAVGGWWAIKNNDNVGGPAPEALEDEHLNEPL